MSRLHVGSGTARGALTIFPIWGETQRRRGYTMNPAKARIGEQREGATVGSLTITNLSDKPLLLVEGQVLEGGLQHRMLARSVLAPAHQELDIDVVCVEQGRWAGGRHHGTARRRASTRVRTALRAPNRQSEVWRRVSEYDALFGHNETSSYVEHMDRATSDVDRTISGLRPFPGQLGIVVALAGHPVSAEVFDSPDTLRHEFDAIVCAAALDAIGLPEIETPSRRVRRFVDRAMAVARHSDAQPGLGKRFIGADEYAEVSALTWHGYDVHAVFTNPRHELVSAR